MLQCPLWNLLLFKGLTTTSKVKGCQYLPFAVRLD